MIAAGWLLAVLSADSNLQTFASHCRFGGAHTKNQVASLYNLLAGFGLKKRANPAGDYSEFAAPFRPIRYCAGEQPKPRIIATGEVPGFQNRDATSGAFVGGNNAIS